MIKELDNEDTPRGNYNRNRNKFKIYQKKLDWSQIPSKLRAAGMIHHNDATGSNDDKEAPPSKTNKISPEQRNTAGTSSSLDPQKNNARYNSNKRLSNIKIFNERIDYSKIRSKIKPLISNDLSKTSLSSSETGSLRILNHPSEYNKKVHTTPTTSNASLNKPDFPRIESNHASNEPKIKEVPDPQDSLKNKNLQEKPAVEIAGDQATPTKPVGASPRDKPHNPGIQSPLTAEKPTDFDPVEKPKSDVRILNDPKDYSHIKSKLVPDPPPKPKLDVSNEAERVEKPKTPVKILNDPRDYSHVRSKLIPDPPPKPKLDVSNEAERVEKPKTPVKILNDPRDYSHVRSKLIPDPPPKPKLDVSNEAERVEKPKTPVKILNDPKDYSHVRSKLIPDPPPKLKLDKPAESKPAEKPKSDVRIVNDPKNYSHVRSKLIPDAPAKENPQKSLESSPRHQPSPTVKVLNAPKDYSHVGSKLPTAGPEPKKSTVKITNKPSNYSHIKSKLV